MTYNAPLFAWLSKNLIKKTYDPTTQYVHILMSTILKEHYKSPKPTFNIHCSNKPVATNTIYFNIPVVDSGVK